MFTQMLRVVLITLLALGVGEAFAAPSTAVAQKTIDDLYADVARLAPGFGGLYVDPDQDTLYVYLLEDTPAAVAELEAALTAVFGARAPKQSRLVVLQGQYSFLDLKAWLERLSAVLPFSGVVFTDISDSRNRVAIGVMTDEVQALVEEQLARLGIPREAVIIEKSPPFELESSLVDRHRPLVGGLQVSFFDFMGIEESECTLGINALRDGVPGFVIASHCTANPGGVEGTVFYQPSSPERIGVETADPRYRVTNADDPNCRPERFCRYSGSAFARRDIGVGGDRGFIAQPLLNTGQPDPTAWNGVDRFRIVDANPMIMEGDHVNKVGIATGWTRGRVSTVGFNVDLFRDGVDTGVTLLGQITADYPSARGDSGAPVFNIIDSLFPNVRLYGLHMSSRGGVAAFSPIQNIQRADFELGPLTVCPPGFAC